MPYVQVNNTKLFYEDIGDAKEIIFFSPGLLMSTALFSKQIDFFKSKFRCIAYDHRGQGKSADDANAKIIEIETNYADTVALIETLNIKPVHFVGVSMGGFVGMRIAARRPDLLKTLTLMATDCEKEKTLSVLKFKLLILLWQILPHRYLGPIISKEIFGKTFLKDENNTSELQFWIQHFNSLRPSIINSVKGVISRCAVTKELPQIPPSLPILILSGTEDKIFSTRMMNALHQKIKQAEFVSIPNAGHSPCWENADLVNQLLFQFLTTN